MLLQNKRPEPRLTFQPQNLKQHLQFLSLVNSNQENQRDFIKALVGLIDNIDAYQDIEIDQLGNKRQILQYCAQASAYILEHGGKSRKILRILDFASQVVTENLQPELEKFKAMIYNNFCAYLVSTRDLSMSEELMRIAERKNLAKEHPQLASIIINNLSAISFTQKNYNASIKYANRARDIMKGQISSNPTPTKYQIYILSHLNLSMNLVADPELNKDLGILDIDDFIANSLQDAKKQLGAQHPITKQFESLVNLKVKENQDWPQELNNILTKDIDQGSDNESNSSDDLFRAIKSQSCMIDPTQHLQDQDQQGQLQLQQQIQMVLNRQNELEDRVGGLINELLNEVRQRSQERLETDKHDRYSQQKILEKEFTYQIERIDEEQKKQRIRLLEREIEIEKLKEEVNALKKTKTVENVPQKELKIYQNEKTEMMDNKGSSDRKKDLPLNWNPPPIFKVQEPFSEEKIKPVLNLDDSQEEDKGQSSYEVVNGRNQSQYSEIGISQISFQNFEDVDSLSNQNNIATIMDTNPIENLMEIDVKAIQEGKQDQQGVKMVKILKIGKDSYQLSVSDFRKNGELYISIKARQQPSKKKTFETLKEEIKLSELKFLFQCFEIQDIAPPGFGWSNIKSVKELIRYCIIPFTQITEGVDNKNCKKLRLTGKSNGIASAVQKIDFLDMKQPLITINHVQDNIFRVVLSDDEHDFRIDLDFQSTEVLFEKISGYQADDNRPVDSMLKILRGYQLEAEEDDIMAAFFEVQELKKYPELFLIDNFVIKNEEEFFKFLCRDLAIVEQKLKEIGITKSSELSSEKLAIYLKIKYDASMQNPTFVLVQDKQNSSEVSVNVQNLYSTWGNKKQKIHARGVTQMKYDEILKYYGVEFQRLNFQKKTAFLSLIALNYSLYTYYFPLTPEQEMDYDSNPIIFVEPKISTYSRIFTGDNCPLTLSVLGTDEKPLGIRATIYNRNEIIEKGVFLFLDPSYWKKHEKVKKSFVNLALHTYHLEYILKRCGWEIIRASLEIQKNTDSNEYVIKGIKRKGRLFDVDRLENILNLGNVIHFLKEREDKEEL